jgi:8-hydroxy-5-deazaflavin:NADPH oxidoreductase
VRLSKSHEILVGSRDAERGSQTASKLRLTTGREVTGGSNEAAAAACDLAILAIPELNELGLLQQLKASLENKIVVSPVVPMKMRDGILWYASPEESAAEGIAHVLDGSRIVAAFHNIPAPTMEEPERKLDFDVLVACDSKEDYNVVSQLIKSIDGLRPLYTGPLSMSREIEGLTPLLLNTAKLNGLRRLSVKFVN